MAALFDVTFRRPLLIAGFDAPQRMVSWSLNRPGFVTAQQVAWLEVRDADLTEEMDPLAWFRARLEAEGLADAVGLMTSRNVTHHHLAVRQVEGITAASLVTLGLNNGECVGARFSAAEAARILGETKPQHALHPGTVNILCAVNVPLTNAALLEASSIVVQARTRAILEADFHRPGNDSAISGTGTDCVVMATPLAEPCARQPYAGLHTAAGEAIGSATLAAVQEAATVWLDDPGRHVF
ncbi:adenosylcobinamide amidohydrolase [Xanthobacter sp. TB0139]|uniref:adenosylcobinamide amidohydrolase n=1 Tax=Xanthobacter sp. TB0139 TaxID=3459178 RepID=UPI0040391700